MIIKAKDGGGGKGMKVAFGEDDIEEAYTMARAEAKAAFPKFRSWPTNTAMSFIWANAIARFSATIKK